MSYQNLAQIDSLGYKNTYDYFEPVVSPKALSKGFRNEKKSKRKRSK